MRDVFQVARDSYARTINWPLPDEEAWKRHGRGRGGLLRALSKSLVPYVPRDHYRIRARACQNSPSVDQDRWCHPPYFHLNSIPSCEDYPVHPRLCIIAS